MTLLLADPTMVAVPVWGLTIASGVVVGVFTLIVKIQSEATVRAATKEQKLTDDAVRAHHDHDDERFDSLDRRLTAEHAERRESDHKIVNDLQALRLVVIRNEERLAALKESA